MEEVQAVFGIPGAWRPLGNTFHRESCRAPQPVFPLGEIRDLEERVGFNAEPFVAERDRTSTAVVSQEGGSHLKIVSGMLRAECRNLAASCVEGDHPPC